MTPRVAFIFTHRIQYFTNLLDELHRYGRIEPVAIYAHETAAFTDRGFGRPISWDNRLDTGFPEVLLTRSAKRSHGAFVSSFDNTLAANLNRLKPDCVHLNGYAHAIQWQAWVWARRHKVPVLLRGDGDTLGRAGGKLPVIRNWLARFFTRGANHVFFQGEENRKYWLARGAYPEKMSWLPCVSDTSVFHLPAFSNQGARHAFRSAHGATPEDVVFVVSGKLESRKRPVDALRMLAHNLSAKIKVWFLGSGPLEADLKMQAASLGVTDHVRWWGFRNQTEMPAVLQAADILLHVSEKDPWPYSVLEGAASGLALMLSDRTGSHPDWSQSPAACVVFSCGDIRKLAEAAMKLTHDSPTRQRLQWAAQERSRVYTEREFDEQFGRVVLKLIGSA